ncbi:MAG: glycosyltransferase family A protein [Thermodesulfobacteriota bacterium]|nr:glycosyltransferase family A protein [Thermodesulfobacteriota bacterium]
MTIDIIVPTYNRSDILSETLESVQAQTYSDWVCWIAEDGESDETRTAVKPFLRDERFHYLPGPHAGTPARPRNRAMMAGKAPFIAFLDDDDLWLPDKLERQMALMADHPDCVLMGCNAFVWDGGTYDQTDTMPRYFDKAPFGRVSYRELVKDDYLINSTVIMRRSALRYAGLQNENLFSGLDGEDYEFWLRVGVLGEIWLLEAPLVLYREVPGKKADFRSRHERRKAAYNTKFKIYRAALEGVGELPGPLSYPEFERHAAICRRERDFCARGPRFLGRLRHDMVSGVVRLNPVGKSMHIKPKKAVEVFAGCRSKWGVPANPEVARCIVFSKDRAMQLHGLLSSYLEQVTPVQPVTVLYDASTESHHRAYADVIEIFLNTSDMIEFVDQTEAIGKCARRKRMGAFKAVLLDILLGADAGKVFFLVDDLVFIEPVDMKALLAIDTSRFVPSLRLGKNLSRCYVVDKVQPLPVFVDSPATHPDMIAWKWKSGELDWAYPLSVDGHLFDRREIAAMAALIPFSAPNTFEDRLQWFLPFFENRLGVAYKKSRIVNIPLNRVQKDIDNRFGTVHQDDLLEKWQSGYQIHYEKLYRFYNESVHQEMALPLKRRGG